QTPGRAGRPATRQRPLPADTTSLSRRKPPLGTTKHLSAAPAAPRGALWKGASGIEPVTPRPTTGTQARPWLLPGVLVTLPKLLRVTQLKRKILPILPILASVTIRRQNGGRTAWRPSVRSAGGWACRPGG